MCTLFGPVPSDRLCPPLPLAVLPPLPSALLSRRLSALLHPLTSAPLRSSPPSTLLTCGPLPALFRRLAVLLSAVTASCRPLSAVTPFPACVRFLSLPSALPALPCSLVPFPALSVAVYLSVVSAPFFCLVGPGCAFSGPFGVPFPSFLPCLSVSLLSAVVRCFRPLPPFLPFLFSSTPVRPSPALSGSVLLVSDLVYFVCC